MNAAAEEHAVQLSRHRLTVKEFHAMGEVGILGEDDRVELIEGELIDMTPIGSKHAGSVLQLNRLFNRIADDRAYVAMQNPVILGDHSEPEPDIALLKPRADFYKTSHPTADDVLLIVEVADTSLAYDREVKIPLYARYGIPEVWVIDLNAKCLEIYKMPQPKFSEYRRLEKFHNGTVAPESLPVSVIQVEDLF